MLIRFSNVRQPPPYSPGALLLARNFKTQRAHSLCLAVGDLTNSFWSAVATGAQQEAERHGYTLVVSNTGEVEQKERHAIDLLRDQRVDGIILCPTHGKSRYLDQLRDRGRPFVFVDRTVDRLDVPSVVTDDVRGMRLAVDHLVGRGHRRIGYVGGPTDRSTFRDRLKGYRQGLAAMKVFGHRPSVTAVIAANFWLTVGTLRAAPDDVVVVGFDDLVLTDLLRRPVTTVVQPAAELGRQAVRLLLDEIEKAGPRAISSSRRS